ncbi:MAG: EAL domain-containing protein [Spirochaetes bacterium]|nr:EAL domain-containing protein [Spirochaetota bacterium]
MANTQWESKLARRLAAISVAGGLANCLLRFYRLDWRPDAFGLYLFAFLVVLSALLIFRGQYKIIVPVMVGNMLLIGLWISTLTPEPRPGPLLVMHTGVVIAAAYYRFWGALSVLAAGTLGLTAIAWFLAPRFQNMPTSLPAGTSLPLHWLSVSFGFTTVSLIISALISYVVNRMEKALQNTQKLLVEATERQTALEEKERLLKLFTELSSDYVYQVSLKKPNLVPQVFAGSFERITGYALDELELKGGWLAIVHPDDRESLQRRMPALLDGESLISEYRIISADGRTVWLRDHVRPIRDEVTGAVAELLGAVHDITERRLAEEQVENLAFYDPLTSLPNRRLLLDRLEQALALSARTGLRGALLFIDLDHFKNLNDTKGHEAGDELLIQQARRLRLCVREGDTVARLGGDEFIIILGELEGDAETAARETTEITQRILHTLSLPVALSYRQLTDYENTCSIGVATFLGHEVTVDELLRRADMAMYQAKADGRNTFRFFDPTMQKILSERLTLEEDLKLALSAGQLELYLQPQVEVDRLTGAEVLLRWQHPEKGMIAPLEFIPAAERTGLIVEIGDWVMRAAVDILQGWAKKSETAHLCLAVNVSARQFRQPDFTHSIGRALELAGVPAGRLKLELTESLALENIGDTVERMQILRSLGVGLSLDDFGTGQSSLSYLKRLPITQLKIDQAFVRDITNDPNDAVLVQTIIGMAKNLKLDIIAEGVETREQRDFLLQHGCSAFQGYLFGKPIPWAEFEATFLKKAS